MEASLSTGQVEFPTLSPGVTLLTMDNRAVGALQSLVLDHLLIGDGTAIWVDARNNAITTTLSKLAPSKRVLERISVARGFTPFQHYGIVEDLPEALASTTELVVAPDIDWFYRKAELQAGEGEQMLEDVLERLHHLADTHEIPVLLSRAQQAGVGEIVAAEAEELLTCELTKFGPRFSGDDFETLVFECADGWMQTTLAYWRRLLDIKHPSTLTGEPTGVSTLGSY